MRKEWESSVLIDAPIERVFNLVADVGQHASWDRFTNRAKFAKPGAADGSGAAWKVWEQLGLFSLKTSTEDRKANHGLGLAKRTIKEVAPFSRVSWQTHAVPNIGIGATFAFEFEQQGDRVNVRQHVTVSVPSVVDAVGRLVVRNLDTQQQGQWAVGLEQLKRLAEDGVESAQVAQTSGVKETVSV